MLLMLSTALAGWTQPQGQHYAKVGGRAIIGRLAFGNGLTTPNEGGVDIDRLVDYQLQLYSEYGMTDRWTLVLQGNPVGYATHRDDGLFYTGPLSAGVRRGLVSGMHNVAVQVDGAWTPGVGNQDLTKGAYADLVYIPAIPTGRATASLSYGVGFGQTWLWGMGGMEYATHPDLNPAVVGWLQAGRTTDRGNRWAFNVPIRLTIGDDTEPANFAAAGNRENVAFHISYTYTFGEGLGVGTAFDAAFALASNLGGASIPIWVEHQG